MGCQPPVSYSNPRDLGQVAAPLRDRLWTAQLMAPRHGLVLVSGKRTDWMQWLLRHERCPGRECDPTCKGHPQTALPGRSHHRNLDAVVSAADMGGIDLDWLGRNEQSFGLNRPVKGEKWHFENHGTPTVRIVPYGQPLDGVRDPNEGHHWMPFHPGDFDGVKGSIYKRGGYNNQVAEVQIRLSKLSKHWGDRLLDPGPVDGVYGAASQAATLRFHQRIIDLQKATSQPVWPAPEPSWGPLKIAQLRWWTA